MFRKIGQFWRNTRNSYRENRIMGFLEGKRYEKMAEALKVPQNYQNIRINDFPFIFLLINQKDKQAIQTLLNKVEYKNEILNDQKNPMSMTPICYAFLDGETQIVDVLQKNGGDLKKLNSSNQNILHLSAIYKQEEAFKRALSMQIDYNHQDQFGNTPFHYVARIANPELTRLLVTARAKKMENKLHQYPVHMAIQSGSLETLQVLKSDALGVYPKFHPIHSASRSGSTKMLQQILKLKPASLNAKDYQNLTPLHHSIMLQDIEMTKQLLSKPGILINETDKYGNSPLHLAMMNGSEQLSRMLLQKNANIELINQDNLTPADYGITSKNKAIHSLLLTWRHKSKKVEEWSKDKY